MQNLLLFLLLFVPPVTSDPQKQFVYCPKGRAGRLIHVPRRVDCPSSKPSASMSRAYVKLWIPTHPLESVDAWKCHVMRHRICTYEDFFTGGGETDNVVHLERVSPVDCHEVIASMRWRGDALVQVQRQMWTTNKTVVAEWAYCCKTHCVEGENFILEKGSVATEDGRKSVCSLGDLTGCPFSRGWCALPDAVVVWTPEDAKIPCPYEYRGEFEASLHDDHVAIDVLNGAFTPAAAPKIANLSCLPSPGFHTAQGAYLETPLAKKYAPKLKPDTRDRTIPPPRLHSLDADPVDAKLEWLYEEMQSQDQDAYRKMQSVLCQVTNKQLDLVHQLLVFDPTMGVRALFGNDSIVAKWVGRDVLLVTSCEQIIADHIFDDHRQDDRCYEYLPVRVKEKTYFAVPGTRELVLRSPEIPCSLVHPTVRFVDGRGWSTEKGPVHVIEYPVGVSWNIEKWHLPVFDSAPLFHTSEEDSTHENVAILRAYAHETSRLRAQMDKMIEYTSTFSVDPEGVASTLAKAEKGAQGFFSNGLGGLLSGPFQAVLNSFITVAVIVGVAYLAYRIAKCYFCRGPIISPQLTGNEEPAPSAGPRVVFARPGNLLR